MLQLILTTLGILIFFNSFSQMDFRPAYYISSANDTIEGLINYSLNKKQFNTCIFKKTVKDEIINFSPFEIKGYGYFNNKYFESKSLDTNQANTKVFVELLLKGKISLFKYDSRYFLEKDSSIYELFITTNEVINNGKIYYTQSLHHLNLLNMLMFDCENTRSKIEKITLNEKQLINLVKLFHKCTSESYYVYKDNLPWLLLSLEPGAGYIYSTLNFKNQHGRSYYAETSFSNSQAPTVGININLSSPRLNESLSLNGGLFYLRSSYSSNYIIPKWWGIIRQEFQLHFEELKIPIGIRYTLFKGQNINPYVNVGISSNILIKEISSWKVEQEIEENDDLNLIDMNSFKTERNHIGYWGGVGTHIKLSNKLKGFLELRYEESINIGGHGKLPTRLRGNVNNFYCLIGLKL